MTRIEYTRLHAFDFECAQLMSNDIFVYIHTTHLFKLRELIEIHELKMAFARD